MTDELFRDDADLVATPPQRNLWRALTDASVFDDFARRLVALDRAGVAYDAVLGDVGDLSDGRPVVVVVPPGSEWILEAFPTTSVERNADGSLTVGLQVTADPWLARLMLRLGAQATATDSVTGADLAPLAAGAAARVLQRYS